MKKPLRIGAWGCEINLVLPADQVLALSKYVRFDLRILVSS